VITAPPITGKLLQFSVTTSKKIAHIVMLKIPVNDLCLISESRRDRLQRQAVSIAKRYKSLGTLLLLPVLWIIPKILDVLEIRFF
jgi:hypothetical protein